MQFIQKEIPNIILQNAEYTNLLEITPISLVINTKYYEVDTATIVIPYEQWLNAVNAAKTLMSSNYSHNWQKVRDERTKYPAFFHNLKTGDYYYIIRMDAVLDRDATDSKKESIVSERKQNAYNDLLKSWTDAADVTLTNAWNKLEVTDKDGYTVYVAPTGSASQNSASGTDSVTSSSAGSVTSSSAGGTGSASVSSS